MDSLVIGRPITELDTPVLLVDIAAMDRNIAGIAGAIRDRGAAWRPHVKAHKTPAIAHRQLSAGAIGVACAKLGEAEVMAAAGIRDILIANQIVGPIKIRRLAALAAHADPIVAVDDPTNIRELDVAMRAHGGRLRVVVEVDTGMGRCGVQPGAETVTLAQVIAASEGLQFAGLMAWEGQVMSIADNDARPAAIVSAVESLTATAAACRDAGLPCEIVSCGGTGTYLTSSGIAGVTEVQAGGGIFGDTAYRAMGIPVEPALTLVAQVISRPTPTRIVLDFGRKQVDPSFAPPEPRGIDQIASVALSIEHTVVTLDRPAESPRPGDRITFDIGFCDRAIHLHENLIGSRDGIVETVWPVSARGRHT